MASQIAFINPIREYYSPVSGGAVTTILMQNARELVARGHRVSVLTCPSEDPLYETGNVILLKSPERRDLSFPERVLSRFSGKINHWGWSYYDVYLRSVIDKVSRLRPAPEYVVFFNDLVAPFHVRKRMKGAKMFVNLQNEIRLPPNNRARLLGGIDRLLTCSQYIRDWTMAEYDLPPDKLSVITSGVDLSAFSPGEDYLRAKTKLRVLFVGRIDRNKGPDIAADAVALLQKEGRAVSLTVAGGLWFYGHGKEHEDPYFVLLKEKMEAAAAQYLGHVTRDQIPEVFRNHDIVCVLSRSTEPFGLVVLEAMASGCAVIASNRGGLPDACGPAGVMVNPDDFTAVVQALRHFCENPEALAKVKKKSREYALECSWSSKVDDLEKFL